MRARVCVGVRVRACVSARARVCAEEKVNKYKTFVINFSVLKTASAFLCNGAIGCYNH